MCVCVCVCVCGVCVCVCVCVVCVCVCVCVWCVCGVCVCVCVCVGVCVSSLLVFLLCWFPSFRCPTLFSVLFSSFPSPPLVSYLFSSVSPLLPLARHGVVVFRLASSLWPPASFPPQMESPGILYREQCRGSEAVFVFWEPVLHVLWSLSLSQSALNPHRLLRARLKPPPAYRQQQVLRFSSESLRGDDSFVFTTVFLCFTAWASGSFAVCELVRENGHHRLTLRGLELTDMTFNLIQDICWHVSAQTQTGDPREHYSYCCTIYSVVLTKCILNSHVSTGSNFFF